DGGVAYENTGRHARADGGDAGIGIVIADAVADGDAQAPAAHAGAAGAESRAVVFEQDMIEGAGHSAASGGENLNAEVGDIVANDRARHDELARSAGNEEDAAADEIADQGVLNLQCRAGVEDDAVDAGAHAINQQPAQADSVVHARTNGDGV